jgi:hypothetical protein
MIALQAEVVIDRAAEHAWAVLADYGRDPEWRRGVVTMAPEPACPVRVGTTTAEVLGVAGRTYRNGGVVTAVEPGIRFTWTTTSGVVADGSRAVEALSPGRCRVRIEQCVHPRAAQRMLVPLLRVLLRRTLAGDVRRLKTLVEAGPAASGDGRTRRRVDPVTPPADPRPGRLRC